jgi:hypothetical protein
MELTVEERRKVTKKTAERYRQSGKRAKAAILDEFTALTGYNRKYAIHLLANEGKTRLLKIGGKTVALKATHKKRATRVYPHYYDEAVQVKLIDIWENFSWQCGKLLEPFLKANVDTLCAHPLFQMDDVVAQKLKKISGSTIDRLLKKPRQKLKIRGTCGTKPARHLSIMIPTKTWSECAKMPVGYLQIDLVQHDGGNPAGEFCYTLTMTDVATCWTVVFALKNKAHTWVQTALETARNTLPFPLLGIHSDNGSEFLNNAIGAWCTTNNIAFSKSRLHKKNDNCFVEQKNFACVRKTSGYARYEDDSGVAALKALYDAYVPLLNLYYPCMKLISKTTIGSKTRKHYDSARPPLQRVLEQPEIDRDVKLRLLDWKAATPLVEQKLLMDRATAALLQNVREVPMLKPVRRLPKLIFGRKPHG